MKWRSLTNREEVELISYINDYLVEKPETIIMIGSDSQNHRRHTNYAIVVALTTPGKGSHILYAKENFSRIRDRFTRLLKEVEYTITIGETLRDKGILVERMQLHFDLNPDPRYKSNEVLRTALGWGQGLGYFCEIKPESAAATSAADMLLR